MIVKRNMSRNWRSSISPSAGTGVAAAGKALAIKPTKAVAKDAFMLTVLSGIYKGDRGGT